MKLKHKVKSALINAEVQTGKCLASENFCIVVTPDVYEQPHILGFEVLVTVSGELYWKPSVTLVAKSHVKLNDSFRAAMSIFNEEMKHAC